MASQRLSIGRSASVLAVLIAAGMSVSLGRVARAQAAPEAKPAASATLAEKSANSPDLAIRKITLYRSGVGYFERSGTVDGNAEVQLRFNTEQVNDILKSMVLLDLDGGRIESVSYGSKEPLAKRLASFGINIASNPGVPELLGQLRGAPIKVIVAGTDITGTILGVEQRATTPTKDVPSTQLPHVNLVTSSGVKSIAITDISSFEILDKELAGELGKALAALAEYRADRTKTVDLRFAGTGPRKVVVGYVHEMPVWKTSYRLVLPENDSPASETDAGGKGKAKGQLVMQGWAIVENTTDQDWSNVSLSLVSGRPVSFQMDLYEPLFAFRPMVPVPTIPGVSPRIFALGVDNAELEERMGAGGRSEQGVLSNAMQSQRSANVSLGGGNALITAARPASAPALYAGVSADQITSYSPKAAAQAASVGELFQFAVDAPVSIERQRSAMIPIISTNVTGRRVSIFNAADGSQFPMRGVEITNDTDLQLIPGPISVLDGSAYAGDAQIGQIPKGDKHLLAYALDLDVAVLTKPTSDSTIVKLSIVDGLVRQTIKQRNSSTYEFANKDQKRGRTIVLEHPKNANWKLVETDKPSEQTQDLYRFNIPVEAGKAKVFSVTQEDIRQESIAVMSVDMPTVVAFHKAGKLSDKVLEAFRQVAMRQSAVNETEREIATLINRAKDISEDQNRIRENITRIDRNSQLYGKYMAKLTEQETELEGMREKRVKAEALVTQQRNDLNDYVRGLNVE